MMKKWLKKTCALLCAAVIFLTGCQGGLVKDDGSGDPTSAKGRYVEEEMTSIPSEIEYVSEIIQTKDGTFHLIGLSEGIYGIWTSTDQGLTWEKSKMDFSAIPTAQIFAAAFTEDGHLYFSYRNAQENSEIFADEEASIKEAPSEEIPTEDSEISSFTMAGGPVLNLGYIGENGFQEMPLSLKDGLGFATGSIKVLPNGDLLIGKSDSIHQFDPTTGQEKMQFGSFSDSISDFTLTDDETLAISLTDTTVLYDLETGEETEKISNSPSEYTATDSDIRTYAPSSRKIAVDNEKNLYACDASGIYRTTKSENISERILDGSLVSLGMPTFAPQAFFADSENKTFFIFFQNSLTGYAKTQLMRYTYNADIPSAPSQILSVYSLEKNATIQQTIGLFQQKYPDVRINYVVGIPEGSGITPSDALRSLSTELLAGKGPDILVLDGIPTDSYAKKGILMDITPLIEEQLKADSYFENIVKPSSSGSPIFAVPARFYAPTLAGVGIDDVHDLASLATWLKTQNTQNIGFFPEIMKLFYQLSGQSWFQEDGSLNEETFKNDLQSLKEMNIFPKIEGEEYSAISDNISLGALQWKGKRQAGAMGYVSSPIDQATIETVASEFPGAQAKNFPDANGNVYLPSTILSINAASKQSDWGKKFISTALSKDVQMASLGDGLPVLKSAITSENDDGSKVFTLVTMTTDTETEEENMISLSIEFPTQEQIDLYIENWNKLSVPAQNDAVLAEILYSETLEYLNGNRTLDETIPSLKNKLDLFLAE